MADINILLNALNEIAAWKEGPKVTGSFDEPRSAKMARDALIMWEVADAVGQPEYHAGDPKAGLLIKSEK